MVEIILLPFECLRIASGHPMTVTTADGEEARARLATPDEFLAMNQRGREWHREHGLECPPPASRADAEWLTAPIGEA